MTKRGQVEEHEATPEDEEYYFVPDDLARMRKLSRTELYGRIAGAYQLAGALLIAARIKDANRPRRNVNGWTDDQVNDAIEKLLNFLWCPADVTKEELEGANAPYKGG